MPTPVNAAPMVLNLGIEDLSGQTLPLASEDIPTHCPKVYLFAKKGKVGVPSLKSAAGAMQMFGADTFDLRKPFATHQTVLSNLLFGAANSHMIERVVPSDAGPKANFCLWLDVLPTQIPLYQRNTDGSYVLDVTGSPKPDLSGARVSGYKVKWVITHTTEGHATDADSVLFKNKAISAGDQTDGQTVSQRYPIFEWWASAPGAFGNDCGYRLYAPTNTTSEQVNTSLMAKVDAYPFFLSAIKRADSTSTPTLVKTLSGDTGIQFVLKPNTVNPDTGADLSLDRIFKSAWGAEATPGFDAVYADLEGLHIYQSNIETLLTSFYSAEMNYIAANPMASVGQDFSNNEDSYKWLFNFLSGTSSSGIPYSTFVVNNSAANSVPLLESTNLYAGGGSDGSLTAAQFNRAVKEAVTRYGDENDVLQETAINVESHMYDTGFPLDVKQAMVNFITVRKDTFLALSTYTVGGPELKHSEEASIGLSLKTYMALAPESTYFGTEAVRGTIMARSGRLLGYNWSTKLPLTLWLAYRSAKMMGASDGKWKGQWLFDKAPYSVVDNFTDLNVKTVPARQRITDWGNGLNYPQPYDMTQFFYPAVKTVYNDDTSVLTSYINCCVAMELEKVGQRAWRQFSGVSTLTANELVEQVNKYVADNVKGRFAGVASIIPNCRVTDTDRIRGYSWTLTIEVYLDTQRTVQALSIQTYRASDSTAAN